MKQIVENLNFGGLAMAKAEINIKSVIVQDDTKATTYHAVTAIYKDAEGVEQMGEGKDYNHPFEYQGGNVFHEAMQSLSEYLQGAS